MSRVRCFKYRVSTMWNSFRALYKLSPEQVDAFVNSFEIYHHDWKEEEKLKEAYGEHYYETVKQKLQDYYSVLNYICSLGPVEKMYIPPMIDPKKGVSKNQELFEQRMAKDLNLKNSSKVLDIGCGRGRVAAHMARLTKAHVTGINIDDAQLKEAVKFSKASKLDNLLQFQKSDLNDIPFPFKDESFDAVYQINVFSLSRDLNSLTKEIYRIMKPGGRFSSCDWAVLESYDPNNPEHVKLVNQIKPLLGAVGTPSKEEYVGAFKRAGFKIIKAEVAGGEATDVQNIDKASKEFTFIHHLINSLVKIRLLPKHFTTLLNQLTDVDAFMEVDRRKLGTTNLHVVAEK